MAWMPAARALAGVGNGLSPIWSSMTSLPRALSRRATASTSKAVSACREWAKVLRVGVMVDIRWPGGKRTAAGHPESNLRTVLENRHRLRCKFRPRWTACRMYCTMPTAGRTLAEARAGEDCVSVAFWKGLLKYGLGLALLAFVVV